MAFLISTIRPRRSSTTAFFLPGAAKEAAAVQERLQKENEDLQTEADSLRTQVRELQTRLETETALREQAQSELEQERTARQGLEAFKPEAERLAAELERLRPEAEAYAQFRDRVGDIECDAHKRAAELEASTTARLRRTVELFRAQYVTLMSSFESTASHTTACPPTPGSAALRCCWRPPSPPLSGTRAVGSRTAPLRWPFGACLPRCSRTSRRSPSL